MGDLRRRFGFWSSLGQMQFRDLLAPEVMWGFILGGSGGYLLVHFGSPKDRTSIAGDYLQITAALVGIVFAGFALVIAFLSDDYLRWLDQTRSGVEGFLRPFLVSTGLQVGVILGAVIYRAAAAALPRPLEHWFFGVVSVLFATAVLDIVALARTVLMNGVARSRGIKILDLQEQRERKRKSSDS